jgi:hypothetical protein
VAVKPYLSLNASLAGTAHGLAKMPYLRDTRRSAAGIGGFRLMYPQLNAIDPATGKPVPNATHGYRFNDTVALGTYFYAGEERPARTQPCLPGSAARCSAVLRRSARLYMSSLASPMCTCAHMQTSTT